MMTTVYAHKGIGIECKLAGGQTITVPAGGMVEYNLTGDQVGKVEAYLASQETDTRMGSHLFGGKVVCKEREAAPPPGSKKALAFEAEKTPSSVIPMKSKKQLKEDAEAALKVAATKVTAPATTSRAPPVTTTTTTATRTTTRGA